MGAGARLGSASHGSGDAREPAHLREEVVQQRPHRVPRQSDEPNARHRRGRGSQDSAHIATAENPWYDEWAQWQSLIAFFLTVLNR